MTQPNAAFCTHCIVRNGTVADVFVDRIFFDCLYSSSDWIGFAFQLVSIGFWIVTQVPQFIDNWKNGSAEALSPVFLADWLLGDTCNLVGCLLTGTQLPLTTGTAWYFVTCDIIMIVQYVYYAAKNARERRTSSRRRKRGLIQAAAAVGEQYLREYDNLNPETSHTVAVDGERVPTVHSAPNMLSLAGEDSRTDAGWQVHQLEPISGIHTLPGALDAPNEASTSQEFLISQSATELAPESGARASRAGASLRLAQIIVFGTGVVVTMIVVWMWMIQSERDKFLFYGMKGLIVKSVDGQGCTGSTHGLRHCMASEEMSLQSSLQEEKRLPLCPEKAFPKWTKDFGLFVGYLSVIAYLKSRVAQLLRNYARRHADGLSASMFICAISANVTGSTGILIRLQSRKELVWQLPWLMGQLGTAGMDVLIALQASQSAARARQVAGRDDAQSTTGQEYCADVSQDTITQPMLQSSAVE